MSEKPGPVEGAAATHTAEKHTRSRRQKLNERLLKWSKLFVGGTIVSVAGALLSPVVAPLGAILSIGGDLAGGVGLFGIVGNVLKRVNNKNR